MRTPDICLLKTSSKMKLRVVAILAALILMNLAHTSNCADGAENPWSDNDSDADIIQDVSGSGNSYDDEMLEFDTVYRQLFDDASTDGSDNLAETFSNVDGETFPDAPIGANEIPEAENFNDAEMPISIPPADVVEFPDVSDGNTDTTGIDAFDGSLAAELEVPPPAVD